MCFVIICSTGCRLKSDARIRRQGYHHNVLPFEREFEWRFSAQEEWRLVMNFCNVLHTDHADFWVRNHWSYCGEPWLKWIISDYTLMKLKRRMDVNDQGSFGLMGRAIWTSKKGMKIDSGNLPQLTCWKRNLAHSFINLLATKIGAVDSIKTLQWIYGWRIRYRWITWRSKPALLKSTRSPRLFWIGPHLWELSALRSAST